MTPLQNITDCISNTSLIYHRMALHARPMDCRSFAAEIGTSTSRTKQGRTFTEQPTFVDIATAKLKSTAKAKPTKQT
jgi:hypothetical protein